MQRFAQFGILRAFTERFPLEGIFRLSLTLVMRVRENISLGNCIPESNLKSLTFIIAYMRYNVIGISFRIAETIPAKYSKYFVFSGGFFYLKQKFLPLDLCRLLMDKRRDRRMKFLHDPNISFISVIFAIRMISFFMMQDPCVLLQSILRSGL